MKKDTTIKELCEFIWYLEDKYNLLDFEINEIKPWQALRVEIYFSIGKEIGVFEKELQRGMKKSEKIISLLDLVKNSITHNPLIGLEEKDILIFSHPRSKYIDGEYIDIYSHYFIKDLGKKGIKFLEFEEHFNGKHIKNFKPYKKYLDLINIKRNIFLSNIKIESEKLNLLKDLQKEFDEYSINLNINDLLVHRVKKFIPTYKIYKKILKKTNPKKIYVLVGYGRAELIKAAKDLNIKTIEFQHGNFSKYHLGYSYPNYNGKLDYFPDEFWVWNEYWKNLINFPILKENIKIYTFRYLEEEKKKYNTKKIENQMIVLCQSGLTDRMAKKVLDNLELFQDKKIVFKLHPGEYGKSNLYVNLIKLRKIKSDIEIVENVDLYKLLAQSEYQAGVFSTALYEGVEFGCKTLLFDLPGIEYMDKFIEMYEVKVI